MGLWLVALPGQAAHRQGCCFRTSAYKFCHQPGLPHTGLAGHQNQTTGSTELAEVLTGHGLVQPGLQRGQLALATQKGQRQRLLP